MSSKIQNKIAIESSPDRVWAVLGDLAGVSAWIPGVTGAKLYGLNRVCATADGHEIKEEITGYSADELIYSYKHLQQPLPVSNSRGTLKVEADGPASVVVWQAEFDVPDPAHETEMVAMINGYYQQTLESLKQAVEQGQ
jgi:uncharacterized protein YndB with AHSA1/START domain